MHFGIIDARMYTGNHPDSCVKFFFSTGHRIAILYILPGMRNNF